MQLVTEDNITQLAKQRWATAHDERARELLTALVQHLHDFAREEGRFGPHLLLFEAIGRVHPEVLGKTLPLNGAGVCGAALADLGLPVELLRGFALLARAAGLLGQIAEERRRPIGMDIYTTVDRNAVYVDPADDAAD